MSYYKSENFLLQKQLFMQPLVQNHLKWTIGHINKDEICSMWNFYDKISATLLLESTFHTKKKSDDKILLMRHPASRQLSGKILSDEYFCK